MAMQHQQLPVGLLADILLGINQLKSSSQQMALECIAVAELLPDKTACLRIHIALQVLHGQANQVPLVLFVQCCKFIGKSLIWCLSLL